MKILSSTCRWIALRWGRIRILAYTWVGKNPYREGSYGSLRWKIRRGKPLTEEEQRDKELTDKAGSGFAQAIRIPPHAAFQIAYLSFAAKLLDGLPRHLRDDLADTAVTDASAKIEILLPLASHQRERTSSKLASYALVISTLAVLVSVATLVAAVCTPSISSCCP